MEGFPGEGSAQPFYAVDLAAIEPLCRGRGTDERRTVRRTARSCAAEVLESFRAITRELIS
jgi:hypothetical protein